MEEEREEELELSTDEIMKQLRKLKKKKAAGSSGIGNEEWKYMVRGMKEAMIKLLKKIWRENGLQEEYRKRKIRLIFKKEENGKVENYRGIIKYNIQDIYKSYQRKKNQLKEKVEEKLRKAQFRFRKKR